MWLPILTPSNRLNKYPTFNPLATMSKRFSLLMLVITTTLATATYAEERRQLSPPEKLLIRFCGNCHSQTDPRGELNLLGLNRDIASGVDADYWHEALNQLASGEMPPGDEDQPTDNERQKLANWIRSGLKIAAANARTTGGQVVLRRLTRYEYQNTMHDLFGLRLNFAKDLPPEPKSPSGFYNNGQNLLMSPMQMETYLQTAVRALDLSFSTPTTSESYLYFIESRTARTEDQEKQALASKKEGLDPATFPPKGLSKKASRVNVGGKDGLFVFPLNSDEFDLRRANHTSFDGVLLGPTYRQLYTLNQWPTKGEMLIRIRIAAANGTPHVTFGMGYRASGAVLNVKPIADAYINGTCEQPQTIELRIRMEEVPVFLSGKPKFRGQMISVVNNSISSDVLLDSIEIIYPAPPLEGQHPILATREDSMTEIEFAAATLRKFVPKAYRRPVADNEIGELMNLYHELQQRRPDTLDALRDTLAVVLTSPHFLYIAEPRLESEPRKLTAHETATRISYFLWSTMPDKRLRELADNGELLNPETLRAETIRLLNDSQIEQFIRNFTYQWLDLGALDQVTIDPKKYQQWDADLKHDAAEETYAFMRHVFNQNISALAFLKSDFVMLNDRMAEFYGFEPLQGSVFRAVPNTANPLRSGVTGQASFLAGNSTGSDSHPIKRGVWITRQLFNDPPPPPPANVPELDESQLKNGLSVVQLLAAHRDNPACNDCHKKIDPWGITLEQFDAIGRFRAHDNEKQPITIDVTLPGGDIVDSPIAMQQFLISRRHEAFATAVVENILMYGLGRELEFTDAETVKKHTAEFIKDGYRLKPLIVRIVTDDAFRIK